MRVSRGEAAGKEGSTNSSVCGCYPDDNPILEVRDNHTEDDSADMIVFDGFAQ